MRQRAAVKNKIGLDSAAIRFSTSCVHLMHNVCVGRQTHGSEKERERELLEARRAHTEHAIAVSHRRKQILNWVLAAFEANCIFKIHSHRT